ncbi:TPA: DUF905 family protein, partial [Escherichia coli]|nr:DUF905 family protein [Escherichia coli]
ASTIFGVHYSLRNFRICQTVLRRRLPHFRLVIRNAEGQRRWRCRNTEPCAGKQLNAWLASEGLLRQ